MLELFKKCITAKYVHTDNDGDFATELDGNTLYILFQWSAGKTDWHNNFDFPAKPYRRMSSLWFCHRGFLRVWLSMRDIIERTTAATLCCHPRGYRHLLCRLFARRQAAEGRRNRQVQPRPRA